mgnify:CR=1 FL=1
MRKNNATLNLRLPEEHLQAIIARAEKQDRSTASYLRQLIQADLAQAGEIQLPLLGKTKAKKFIVGFVLIKG